MITANKRGNYIEHGIGHEGALVLRMVEGAKPSFFEGL